VYNNSYNQEINGYFQYGGSYAYKSFGGKLDGNDLFNVRGVSSFPSEQRAKIGERIKIVANPSINQAA
jgi:hypothetical protein